MRTTIIAAAAALAAIAATQAHAEGPGADELFAAWADREARALEGTAPVMYSGGGEDALIRAEGSLIRWPAGNRGKAWQYLVPDKHFCEAAGEGVWDCTFVLPLRTTTETWGLDDPAARTAAVEAGLPGEFQKQVRLIAAGGGYHAPDVFVIPQPDGVRDLHTPIGCRRFYGTGPEGGEGFVRTSGCAVGAQPGSHPVDCGWVLRKFRALDPALRDPGAWAFFLYTQPAHYVACIEGTADDPGLPGPHFDVE